MRWVNFFHIYQPPGWNKDIIQRVVNEAYLPMADILHRHPKVRITLNFAGSLVEQLAALGYDHVLETYRQLIERGQVELVGSAMYHPILPLIPEAEVRRQIMLQHEIHQKVFGIKNIPEGFFAPEMAFGPALVPILQDLGFRWIILDEITIEGSIGQVPINRTYRTAEGFGLVVRDRPISNLLSFTANLNDLAGVRSDMLNNKRGQEWLITGMDGENIGHHRPGVEKLWEALITDPAITPATVADFLKAQPEVVTITPHAANWSSELSELRDNIPFGLWHNPNNPIHMLQWKLTGHIIDAVHRSVADKNYDAARTLLDRALASDKYWWASASPWWDMPIILRETQKLADVIDPLMSLPTEKHNQVDHLLDQITQTVNAWEKDGVAKQRQATYLSDTGNVRYMAGEQVTPE